ncbi:PIN domain-containing protein [Thermodesulfatator atlanticus]|uniref:PIN domain-containing protein n=1 Tax=Thermodesulfatator atlanticus TaxID=501497 RepID=UPI0003B6F6FB|nr:PIN domain-containing protein [Thermodesulfatator atlanticus]
MKEDRIFVDTNIWIYGLTESRVKADQRKREISLELLEELFQLEAQIIISIQVLNECHWNLIKKFELPDEKVTKLICKNVTKIANIVGIDFATYKKRPLQNIFS